MAGKGGRIPAQGRPPQAPGVGKDAKRHDLEKPKTPGYHGSDLQQGDVQAMEQGQRIAPATVQKPARGSSAPPQQTTPAQAGPPVQVPDAIDFLGDPKRNGQAFNAPQPRRQIDSSKALTWLPIIRRLAEGPGASSALVSAFINQARNMQAAGGQQATVIDMNAIDSGIQSMIDANQAARQQ